MSDKILVLKNSKKGLVVDTILKQNDTIFIDQKTTTTIELPNKRLEVNTYPPAKDGWDILMIVASIIGVIAAVWAAVSAYKQLIKKDEDKQKQLAELKGQTTQLIKQNKLFEKRIRMMVKPLLWTTGGGFHGTDRTVNFQLNNRGEICFIDSIVVIEKEGLQQPKLNTWFKSVTLDRDKRIQISGDLLSDGTHPKDAVFRILVKYHDKEKYKYESIIEWSRGRTELMETIEIEKDE